MKPDLSVDLAGITLANPVLVASGTFGYGREYADLIDLNSLGGIIVKGTALEPWPGNPPPRVVETPAGMLNAIGLQNPGVEHFLREDLPYLREVEARVIVNIVGRTVEEYRGVAERLQGQPGVDGLELNISCPNVKAGGMAFGTDAEMTYSAVRAVRQSTSLPLLVKLSPNVTRITDTARAAVEAGADGISLINTLLGMAIDPETRRPVLANTVGGLSGPAIMPVALRMVWEVAQEVEVPLLGMGGINSPEDTVSFILAGARAVAVGTGLFYDPGLPARILSGLSDYMTRHGLTDLSQLEGMAWKGDDTDGG